MIKYADNSHRTTCYQVFLHKSVDIFVQEQSLRCGVDGSQARLSVIKCLDIICTFKVKINKIKPLQFPKLIRYKTRRFIRTSNVKEFLRRFQPNSRQWELVLKYGYRYCLPAPETQKGYIAYVTAFLAR